MTDVPDIAYVITAGGAELSARGRFAALARIRRSARSLENFGGRVALAPLSPGGVVGWKFGEPPLEVFPLYPQKPLGVWVPKRVRLPVVQDKGVPVGPP